MKLPKSAFILFQVLWLAAIFVPGFILVHFNRALSESPSSSESQAYLKILHELGLPGFVVCFVIYLATVWTVLFLLRKLILDKIQGDDSSQKEAIR